jgi:rubredoxin
VKFGHRCRICDYDEAHGSAYAGLSPDGRKVVWDGKSNGYICEVCLHEAETALQQWEEEDECDTSS